MQTQNMTASIPHQLTREEAKRLIQSQMGTLRKQIAAIASVQETWAGNKMSFSLHSMGQPISGHLTVEDHTVEVEVSLPWFLSMLAGNVKQTIEQQGRALLNRPVEKK
jgi:predicted metal-dependent hydrolase